jgi:valyl-tRNA synthetase
VQIADKIDEKQLNLPDHYIVYELKKTITAVTEALDQYRFSDAAQALYKFTWNEFCDWYLELSKPVLYGEDKNKKSHTGAVLVNTLERLVKLLHPFIPFVTEEIYHLLPGHKDSIMVQPYPTLKDDFLKIGSEKAAHEIEVVKEVVSAIRNIRGENRIAPGAKIKVRVATEDKEALKVLETNKAFVLALARLENAAISPSSGDTKKCAVTLITMGKTRINVIVPLEGLVDFQKEIDRLQKDLEKNKRDLDLTEKKLSSENFVKNAPTEVVAAERERLSALKDKQSNINASLQRLQ